MNDYETLGHISRVHKADGEVLNFYLPHYVVLNMRCRTNKLRAVFDASGPSDTILSLNNLQALGLTVQDDLFSIILRFRMHQIVVSANIEKISGKYWWSRSIVMIFIGCKNLNLCQLV